MSSQGIGLHVFCVCLCGCGVGLGGWGSEGWVDDPDKLTYPCSLIVSSTCIITIHILKEPLSYWQKNEDCIKTF